MMDVTVKTLDGQNRSFCVPENITVRQFKEKIAGSISIESDTQRLIFQGRVLQDDKLLKDYDVHGKVIHVVQKPPPSTRSSGESSTTTSSTSRGGGGIPSAGREGNNFVLGSFSIPSDIIDPNQVQQIVQNAVQNMGDMGRNARVSTRSSNDGSSVDVHIHLGQMGGPPRVESESQLRINNARRMLRMAREQLATLENAGQAAGSAEQTEASRTSAGDSTENAQEDMETQQSEREDQPSETSQSAGTSSQSAETTQEPAATSQTSGEGQTPSSTGTTTSTESTGSQPRGQGPPHPPGLIRPPITTVADVLQEVLDVNRRLQPFLERYQTLVRNDPTFTNQQESDDADQLSNTVGQILHTVSHCYHSLSDLMIDFSESSPRHLYAAFITHQTPATAVIQQTIPVRAQFNIGSTVQRSSGTQSSVPTTTAGTQSSQPQTNSTGTQSNVSTASASTSTPTPLQGATSTQPDVVTTSAPTVSMMESGTTPMFIEMGPEIVSVSSVTAQIITEPENPTTSSSNTGTTNTSQQIFPGNTGPITNDLIQSIVNSVLQAHGAGRGGPRFGQPNAVQIEIGPTRVQRNGAPRFPTAPGTRPTNVPTGSVPTTQNPTTSATSTQTNTSESTNSSGTQTGTENTSETQTQTPQRPRTAAFVMPGIPNGGLPGLPGMPRFPDLGRSQDPYLPCTSRHFYRSNLRPRRRRGEEADNEENDMPFTDLFGPEILLEQATVSATSSAASSTSAPSASTTSTPSSASSRPTPTSSSTSRPSTNTTQSTDPFVQMLHQASQQLPGVVGIQIQGMQDGQPIFSSMSMPPFRFGQRPPFSTPGHPQQPGATGMPPRPPQGGSFETMLRDFLQNASSQQRPTTTASSSTTNTSTTNSTGTSQPSAMTDESFTRLVSGIGGLVSQTALGQPPSQPIADFLSSLGEGYNPGEEGGLVNDLFHCLSRHLSMPDLLQIFYGNPTALNRMRAPLQDFIRGRILNDGEPTLENIEAAVNRLVNDMQDELRSCQEVIEVKPDIDFVATLSNICRIQLIATIRMIMQTRGGDPNFGVNLYERVRQALSEVIILTRHCLVGGMPAVDRLIQNRLNNITRGVNPLIQQWMCSTSTQQLNSFVPSITVTEEQVLHYVVKKEKVPSPEAPMETSPVVQSPGAATVESPKSMEVDPKMDDKPSPSGAVNVKEPVEKTETSPGAAAVEEPVINGATGGEPSTSYNGASGGDTSWQKEIPEEWVPIINGDIEKQKHQKPQRPFSGAYYQGMPAKRRKLNQPQSTNSTETGVEPIGHLDNLTKDAKEK